MASGMNRLRNKTENAFLGGLGNDARLAVVAAFRPVGFAATHSNFEGE
jgi:hypothetical protein